MYKKFLLTLILLLTSFLNINALSFEEIPIDNIFHVYDISYDGYNEIGNANSYKEALQIFNKHKDEYNNLSIFYNGLFYKLEYGIVTFNIDSKCTYNIEFINRLDRLKNYINGCYGIDGAYIDTDDTGENVTFKVGGVVGIGKMKDMKLYPIQLLPGRLTKYKVINNELYHQIKQSFTYDYYSSLVNLGDAPEYLENDKEYYSYDGHYFYEDDSLWKMLEDYRNNNYSQSINKDNPYYNYYQYLSSRSISSYLEKDFNSYLTNTLNINSSVNSYIDLNKDSSNDTLTSSQFYNQMYSFIQYQYQYGSNALMMLALSMNESAIGRSSLAFTRNNLFGHSAFDSDVEKNASRYLSVGSSVYSHAKYYISNTYCNPNKFQYNGCFFGDKSNGMNYYYASDPYWGEKAAQNYHKLDKALGMLDKNLETIGIKNKLESINIYQYPENDSKVLYKSNIRDNFSVLIVDEFSNESGEWYKVRSDATLNENSLVDSIYYYNFVNNVGYIRKDDIDIVIRGRGNDIEYKTVTFNSDNGSFKGGDNVISYNIEKGKIPSIENPMKDGYEFVSWDKELAEIEEDTTYNAIYKKVNSIKLKNIPKTQYEIKDRIDISNGSILINYDDNTSVEKALDTNMISGYDFNVEGDQEVIVTYAGNSDKYLINVSKELDDIRKSIKDEIVLLIDELNNKTLSNEDIQRILTLKNKIDENMLPYLNQEQLRKLDELVYRSTKGKVKFLISKNNLDLSISGLSLSINDFKNKFFKDKYSINISNNVSEKAKELFTNVAKGNSFTSFNFFKVNINKNNSKYSISKPIIISIKKPKDAKENQLFTVLRYDNNSIVETYTRQSSNYIYFMSEKDGEFMVVAKNTTNTYGSDDHIENINKNNVDKGINMYYFYIIGGLSIVFIYLLKRKIKK